MTTLDRTDAKPQPVNTNAVPASSPGVAPSEDYSNSNLNTLRLTVHEPSTPTPEFSQPSDGPRWKIVLRQEMDRLYLEYMCPLQPSTPKGLMIPAPFSKQDLSPR
jgi:hypothetical protein